MFINKNEINNFPFSESATLILSETKYTFPVDLLLDACVYPRCSNNAPFHVYAINKWEWDVADASGAHAFTMLFKDEEPSSDYYVGHCIDQVGYCGSILGTKDLYRWIRAIPGFHDLPYDSLEFTARAVRPVGSKTRRGSVVFNVNGDVLPVTSVGWGEHVTVTPAGAGTVTYDYQVVEEAADTPISRIVVNSASNASRQISIVPTVGSKVRVLANSDIRVGKVSEL